jgi:thioredoxin-dependent peroxiredoxin
MQSLLRVVVLTGMLSPCWVSGGRSCAADPPLSVGQIAPAFTCLDSDGKTWNSQDLLGKQRLVVYFYPSSFDFCSTRQALHYQQQLRELAKADVTVVAISGDQVATQQLFKAANQLDFVLLADDKGAVARQFGVPLRTGGKTVIKDAEGQVVRDDSGSVVRVDRQFTAARWTFVIDKDGLIASIEKFASPRHDSHEVLATAVELVNR